MRDDHPSTGSGKSVALYDMIVNPKMLGGKFDFILIVSPTLFTDKLWEELATGETKLPKLPNKKRPHLLVLTEYDQPKIDKLLELQKGHVEDDRGTAASVLLILDDCGPLLMRNDVIAKAASLLRHYKMMVVITAQKMKQIPTPIRTQVRTWILFATALSSGNKQELETISQIVAADLEKGDFIAIWKEAVRGSPYDFLVVDTHDPPHTRFRKGFEHYLTLE